MKMNIRKSAITRNTLKRSRTVFGERILGLTAIIALLVQLRIFLWVVVGDVRSPRGLMMLENAGVPREQNDNDLKTMIIMSDSRPLHQLDYHALAYTINAYYAKRHGYLIRFVQTPCLEYSAEDRVKHDEEATKRCVACIHEDWGGRTAPWCKLKAINDTMHRFGSFVDRFVYIDSDAFVAQLDVPFKEEYFQKPLNMFWNNPWNSPPVCTGIQFWQNNDMSHKMIDAWWNSNTGEYNLRHDYEQSVFRFKNSTIARYVSHIGIIRENVRENKQMDKDPFFRHITIKKNKERFKRMEAFMSKHKIG